MVSPLTARTVAVPPPRRVREQGLDGVERVAETSARDQQAPEPRAQLRARRVVRALRQAALQRDTRALGVAAPRPQPGVALGARRPGGAVARGRARRLEGARRVLVAPEQAEAGREREALGASSASGASAAARS